MDISKLDLGQVCYFQTNQSGSEPLYTATVGGEFSHLLNFTRALCKGAWNGSENAHHPSSLSGRLRTLNTLTPEDLAGLIGTSAPAHTPKQYQRKGGVKHAAYKHSRFWVSRPSDQWTRWSFYWIGGFRAPGDFDPQPLPTNVKNTVLMLTVDGTKVRLVITGGNELSVRRRMAAALGEDDVPAAFEIMKGMTDHPLRFNWENPRRGFEQLGN